MLENVTSLLTNKQTKKEHSDTGNYEMKVCSVIKPYFNYKLDVNLVFTSLWQVDTGFAILFFI